MSTASAPKYVYMLFQICLSPLDLKFLCILILLPVKVLRHRQQATSHATCDTLNNLILLNFSL